MQQSKISLKKFLSLFIVLVLVLVVYIIFISISRLGKEKVSIETIPNDASIYISGKKISNGDNYIKKGTYLISVKRPGFETINETIIIPSGGVDIGFAPEPVSTESKKWIQENPNIQKKREAIGGKMAAVRGGFLKQNTPIIVDLPYVSIDGPFSIDYGISNERKYKSFLDVNNSTPVGREAAIQWIRDSGYDPTDFDIRFRDYNNPLVEYGGDGA